MCLTNENMVDTSQETSPTHGGLKERSATVTARDKMPSARLTLRLTQTSISTQLIIENKNIVSAYRKTSKLVFTPSKY